MKVDSFWRCSGSAGVYPSVESGKDTNERQHRYRLQWHLSKSEFETVLSGLECGKRPVEDAVLRNLRLENLREAIAELDVQGQNLLSLRYSGELTMEEIGQIYGISRMAVSKRLKKLHEKLGSSVS